MSENSKITPKDSNIDHEWYYRFFDSLSFPTLILDTKKRILSANARFLEKFGITKNEVIGKRCYEYFEAQDRPCSTRQCPARKVLTEKKGCSLLREIKTGETPHWEERVFSPILNDEGEVTHIIESLRDVTRIKTLEKRLSGILELMQRVLQSSASAIIAASRKGRILLMNQAAEDLFGNTMGFLNTSIETRGVEHLYPHGVAREIMNKLRSDEYGGKGKLTSTRIDIINSEGEAVPVSMTAAIIYEDNMEVGTMGIYNDLRERLKVEKKLKEVEKLSANSEKMASLGQLSAGVAHEINNPLTGILLYANMFLERIAADDPGKEDLEFIIEDANRCKEIVKNLLIYSRQTNPSKEVIHINDLLEQSMALVRDQEFFMNIEIFRNLSNDMMLLQVDKNQLNQVIINLVLNAVDAMNRKGCLTFCTWRNKGLQKIYLEVSDTGCGISEDDISKVFDPFFTTKELGKGTGLGLSTVYGIVHENGGNISIKETGPKGTTFLLEFPLYQPSTDYSESVCIGL
ncbi:PAS domain S-box protein [Desulfobacterales bacterium HSG16]|nr:PAS domain S-box protein [Desulfobacterales bacterium HSG16]